MLRSTQLHVIFNDGKSLNANLREGVIAVMTLDTAAIRAAMLEQGIGPLELSKRADMPRRVASTITSGGNRKARVATITKLARGLNVAPMDLVKREDNDGD